MEDAAPSQSGTLYERLNHVPQELHFGTSGRRGKVTDLTQLEVYINALGELEYLQSLPKTAGGIEKADPFYFAYDLRPSSTRYVSDQQGRGEIAQAVEQAIFDAGMQPVNLGQIPTPALMHYAIQQGKGSIMVTGSHIPFERNGYKTNKSIGELLKKDERPINARVQAVRERVYQQRFEESPFDENGLFKSGSRPLSQPLSNAKEAYLDRYLGFFQQDGLRGLRLLAYQHSAVGRDILVEMLERLGANVIPAGRSDAFVPIDTENIDSEQLTVIQDLVDEASSRHGPIDAVVSTDGDSDRPLVLGVDPQNQVRFFGGDLLGMIVAEHLDADAVVVPISCNDGIDAGPLKERVAPKTKIGSPYVIAGMEQAKQQGKQIVCGWEANGGFLLGSDIRLDTAILRALPTRDAMLPILSVLSASVAKRRPVTELFANLPPRYSRATLLKDFPRATGLEIVRQLSPESLDIRELIFSDGRIEALTQEMETSGADAKTAKQAEAIRRRLEALFSPDLGFGSLQKINYIDGVRVYFDNGDVAHIRPSGNADELRLYAVADTQARADEIATTGTADNGPLRQLERQVTANP